MKKKTLILVLFLSFIVIIFGISTIYQDSSTTPQSYANIDLLEKELDVKVYPIYDIIEYIEKGNKKLIKNSNKDFLISGKKDGKKIFYSLELADFVSYSTEINVPVSQSFENCQKTDIGDGVLYQYHYIEDKTTVYVGIFVKDNMKCEIALKNNEIDQEIIEEKIIEYFKDIENV